jgi:hypothetical protein
MNQFTELVDESNKRWDVPGYRGSAYDKAKGLLQNRLLEVFYEQFPNLKSKVSQLST